MKCIQRLFIIICVISFLSCHKDSKPPTSRIHEIYTHIQNGDDSAFHLYFSYDGKGRVKSMQDNAYDIYITNTEFTYNSSGQLYSATMTSNTWAYPVLDTFFYSTNGMLSRVSISGKTYGPNFDIVPFNNVHFLTNDAKGRIVRDSIIHRGDDEYTSGYNFLYDQNGDITGWRDLGPGALLQIDYTNTNNPFKDIAMIYYFIEGDFIGFSKHAPKTFQPGAWNHNGVPWPVNYSYEFNGNGSVQRIHVQDIPAIPTITDIDIKYE